SSQMNLFHSSQQGTIANTSPPVPTVDYNAKPFFAVYSLRPDEYIKIIPPPFIPQRWPPVWMKNYREIESRIGEDPLVDCLFIKQLPDGTMIPFEGEDSGGNGKGLPGLTVREMALQSPGPHLGRVRPWQIEGDTELLETCLPGDVVVRDGATIEQIIQGIGDALSSKLGRKVAFTNDHPQRDVVVVTGISSEERLHLHIPASLNTGRAVFPTSGRSQFNRVLDYLTTMTGQLFLDQTENSISAADGRQRPVVYSWDAQPADNNDESAEAGLTDMLKSLSDQTGFTFKHEVRAVDVWTLAPASPANVSR
ncbi:MAG TPA: hypothetical protein VKK61_01655, partial [Tepidisphaeraceae bacterium]|nr:hypothetical protein [Tepidisphaeraceae bacterium]